MVQAFKEKETTYGTVEGFVLKGIPHDTGQGMQCELDEEGAILQAWGPADGEILTVQVCATLNHPAYDDMCEMAREIAAEYGISLS